jgi:hypothetical protein
MIIKFVHAGRLGNAIFRYLACCIMCLYYNASYSVIDYTKKIKSTEGKYFINESHFINISNKILQKTDLLRINDNITIEMSGYYQHDVIYKINKNAIINFIKNNPSHYIVSDGINPGDGICQEFNIIDIVNTPLNFNKVYKNVLHLRLEDFVTHNLYLNKNRIIELLKKNIIEKNLCIVCKKPTTKFEFEYIKYITDFLYSININCYLEHNDVLTDYYIMKEAIILICSKSTLSWSAAFFSDKIQKCYLPDYEKSLNSTCKYPIDNTELY